MVKCGKRGLFVMLNTSSCQKIVACAFKVAIIAISVVFCDSRMAKADIAMLILLRFIVQV